MIQSAWPEIDQSWLNQIGGEFDKPYMAALGDFLRQEKKSGHVIYPQDSEIFHALNRTHFEDVRVVIIGQDPYHGPGQAHGLAFSVRPGIRIPPSLQNIYKELQLEYGTPIPRSGDLTGWAEQGVLLLNATLTVQQGRAGSHQKKGWEALTDAVIGAVNERHEHIVFMLWGAYAQKKGGFIDCEKHLVLAGPHPSPLSAHRGFFGCGHFKAANDYLIAHGRMPVDWAIR